MRLRLGVIKPVSPRPPFTFPLLATSADASCRHFYTAINNPWPLRNDPQTSCHTSVPSNGLLVIAPRDAHPGHGSSSADGLLAADWNGDGRMDDIVVSYPSENKVTFHQAECDTCNFWRYRVEMHSCTGARALDVSDVDGDGDADLIVLCHSPTRVVWVANQDGSSSRRWSNPSSQRTVTGTLSSSNAIARAGDMTGDGRADVVVSIPGGSLTVYTNNGGGSFQPRLLHTPTTSLAANYQGWITLAKLDSGSSALSILAPGIPQYWRAGGTSGSINVQSPSGGSNFPSWFGDVNGDGVDDLFLYIGWVSPPEIKLYRVRLRAHTQRRKGGGG